MGNTVHVIEGKHGSLLSFATASKLGLVDVKVNNVATDSNLIEQYPSVFQGIGKLKNFQVKLHIDETVPPLLHAEFHFISGKKCPLS